MTNFYYSFLFLPPSKRRAIEAVYAFARRGDDLADSGLSPEEARQGMMVFRQALDDCFAGPEALPSDPELRALGESILMFRIPRRPFDDLILGLEMDLNATRYETFEELKLYCYRVASTIGLIAIEIFEYQNPRARDYAVNLGIALQLVNILRDLRSDALRGRVYLPEEDLRRYGMQPGDLTADTQPPSFSKLLNFQCERARYYFHLARQMLPPEDRRSMAPAEIMAAIYWRLLARIQKRGYNPSGERVRLSRPLKFWTALSVYLGAEWRK